MKIKKIIVMGSSILVGLLLGLIIGVVFHEFIIEGSFIIVFEISGTVLSFVFIAITRNLYK